MTAIISPSRSAWGLVRPRLRAPASPGESLRIERVIAVARVLLTTIALVQITIYTIEPSSYAPVAQLLLIFYAAHSVSALLVLNSRQRSTPAFALTTHTIDLVATAITLPMAAPTNTFFAFYLFVLAAAAFRWGFRETLATTAAAIGLVVLHARLVNNVLVSYAAPGGDYDLNRVIVRAAYLVMMGLLLGYLGEEGRLLRAEAGAIAGLLGKIRVTAGVTRAVGAVAREIVALFNASHLVLVIEDRANHRLFRWDTVGGWSVWPTTKTSELSANDRRTYFFGRADLTLAVVQRRWPWSARSANQITALDASGRTVDATPCEIPDAFGSAYAFRRLLTAPVTFGDEWSGRLFVFDPKLDVRLIALAQFLQTVVRQVGPVVFSVYLLSRLQTRAGALERARVARELHDGVIQSLIGVEMQLEVMRNREWLRATPAADELARLQNVLRNEVLNLRDLMQQMRPPEFDPDALLDHLADIVQRFGRDTGISARFVSDLKEVQLPWRVCFELVRILQEGLVNIRKHSAATNVLVRFGVRNGFWTLEIDDDGRGFPFEGRLSQVELDARRSGPTIIKERVRAIGGQLAIDSTPGRGARLEVLVPQEAHG